MLKTVSSITNALGALNYKGTWNASTNTPTLTSSVGAKGDYYVVSVAGSTNLNGEALWGVGDWAVFNGSVWQRVEGGDTINATIVTTPIVQAVSSAGLALKNSSGTTQLSLGAAGDNITLSVATNITPANAAVAISPTGSGTLTINPATASTMNNVAIGGTTALAGSFTTVTATTGNVVIGTSGQGIDFSATPNTGTSELLADYEEGTWTPVISDGTNNATMSGNNSGVYTKIGRQVTVIGQVETTSLGSVTGNIRITGLPFTAAAGTAFYSSNTVGYAELLNILAGQSVGISVFTNNNYITMFLWDSLGGVSPLQASEWSADGTAAIQITYFV
jgi:hypothetical protein